MQESEARGGRPKRLTTSGYWKATGSPGYIYSSGNRTIGVKRTMVFYVGRAPSGRKTEWKMNEYKAIEAQDDSSGSTPKVCMQVRQEYSLCRVYKHSKCLRAFDRRPTAPINQVTHQQLDLPSGTGTALVTESSSAPNSLVNDHACSSSAAGNCFSDNDGDHPIDDNPNEVNWDQLDWFYRNE
ncbi:hypothetical protein SAY87_018725 [Trapa incisa]|uniref:NAC domain-containing protein n=1 Tax=Trapa incisa TaxID=236973 RepID=A0AAN7K3A1_9MYRT|nr:hypothetical protein SAY87_018725 [Trapa incisa]